MRARTHDASAPPDSGLKRESDSRWSRLARPRVNFDALVSRLLEPVDNSSIVFFRIAFGIIMLWEVQCYLNYGWVASEYIDPPYYFPYAGFERVRPWPGVGMYIHLYALGLLAMCIAAGFFYRVSTILFAFGITYVFLLDKAHFLNHMYLAVLISFMLIYSGKPRPVGRCLAPAADPVEHCANVGTRPPYRPNEHCLYLWRVRQAERRLAPW